MEGLIFRILRYYTQIYSSPSKEIHLDTSSESNLHCYDHEKLPECNCCEILFLTRIMSCIFGIKMSCQ